MSNESYVLVVGFLNFDVEERANMLLLRTESKVLAYALTPSFVKMGIFVFVLRCLKPQEVMGRGVRPVAQHLVCS